MKKFVIVVLLLGIGAASGWLVGRYQTRPCILKEERIRQEHAAAAIEREHTLVPAGLREKIQNAKMYAELAEYGCPQNKYRYKKRHGELMDQLRIEGLIASGGAEIRIDMEKVGQAVEAAVAPAVDAMMELFDRVRDTKISITVQ